MRAEGVTQMITSSALEMPPGWGRALGLFTDRTDPRRNFEAPLVEARAEHLCQHDA